jgi:hypothetical protein
MEKRLTFKCWHCDREYSLLRDLSHGPKLLVACPFCEKEAVVDLSPYRSEVVGIYQSQSSGTEAVGEAYRLPDVLPTIVPDDQSIETE